MLKYKHTFTGEGSFAAWMFRTARNVNYDHFRKNKSASYQEDIDEVAYKINDVDNLDTKMDQNDTVSQLNLALQKLPAEKREILVLSKYKSLKFSEIGELLGCSEGAAKVKAHRAVKDLRTIFLQLEKR